MRFGKHISTVAVLLFVFASSCLAADLNYPYGRFTLKLPPSEDPFPGLGNYYSTLSKGMKSALWNPASLAKLKLSEASISWVSPMDSYNYQKSFKVAEPSGTMEVGEYGVFFRYPEVIGTGVNTKEVEILSNVYYGTSTSGINFTSALKVNDWLSLGFSTNNPLETDMNLAGDFPVTARADTNLYGQKISEMQIGDDGKLKYTFSSGGIVTTYESTKAIWSGFASQEVTIPLIGLSELRNNLNLQSPYTGTIAAKFGNFCLGLNMIPVSATADINNNVRAVVDSDTPDQFFYVPNFDPNNQSELATWINDPDKYSKSNGYKRKQIRLPAGQIIGEAKYRGFYSASTARFDLGSQYDVTDWLTLGVVLENFGGSSLNFKGNGISSYINYRDVNTAEAPSFNDLLLPGGKTSIDLISDRWVTTSEAEGVKLYLEPEKNYNLPKRLRYGIALKKPFLICLDYEQNQTPITISGSTEASNITISNLNFLRIGADLFLMKGGLTLLLKPTVTGGDQQAQDNINKYFKYGALPIKLDLGSSLGLFGYEIGGTFGINALPIISLLQFDTTNIDLSKMVYYNTYIGKDAWQISYLARVDPLATAAAYGTKTVPAGKKKEFDYWSDIKFVQTLGVTYRF